MINYIEIAREIESLAVDKGVFFFCVLIGVIGVLIFLFGFQFFLIDLDDDWLDKIKSLFLGTVILFISGLVFSFCWFKIETSKKHQKKAIRFLKIGNLAIKDRKIRVKKLNQRKNNR